MTELFLDNIYLTLFLPLWFFLIIMIGRFFSVYVHKNIIYSLTLIGAFLGILLTGGALWKLPSETILETQMPFIKINDFVISCGIYVDKLALIFALILFIVSFLVQFYSISYMKSEKKNYRFFALLNLFNFGMIGLFFSPNLFETYFFWEIIGIVSYLLIGFEYFKKDKSIASQKVLIMNRIGDTALISAIIACTYFMYSYAPNKNIVTLSFTDMNIISTLIYAYASHPIFLLICTMFIIGILVKSAQFPFYTWLQDAMEAKLPVSALLHSATLVSAGVFLMIRLIPLFTMDPYITKIIALIGLLTALICSLSACSQTNPKKVLAYSTSAQLGLVFFAIGILNIKSGLAYFIAHALIKSMLFLALPKDNKPWSYSNFIAFLVAGLSLSGLIFSGMLAKEFMVTNLGTVATFIFAIISFITAFYIIRIALVLAKQNGLEKTSINKIEFASICGLLISNILFYFFLRGQIEYKIAEPFWSALTAWIFVYILYSKNAFWKVPILYPLTYNGFYLDKFYSVVVTKIYYYIATFAYWIDKNIFGNYYLPVEISKLGVRAFNFIEKNIMNGTVNSVEKTCKRLSIIDKVSQSGNVQKYNANAFIIVTVVLTSLIIAYMAIINYIGSQF